ncbi:hypothetical protein Q7P35_012336 [Cladosporium inversicolor]
MHPNSFYAVYDDDTPNRSPRMWNYSQGLYLALENVRVVRNQIINPYAGDTFAVDRILPTDPAYPFCNRIGELRSDPRNHLGYRFSHGGRDVSVWIQKMPVTSCGAIVGSLKVDLEDPAMAWAVQRTTLGYWFGRFPFLRTVAVMDSLSGP